MFRVLLITFSVALLLGGLGLTLAIVFFGYSLQIHPDFFLLAAIFFTETILPLFIGVFISIVAAIFFFKLTGRKTKKD